MGCVGVTYCCREKLSCAQAVLEPTQIAVEQKITATAQVLLVDAKLATNKRCYTQYLRGDLPAYVHGAGNTIDKARESYKIESH
eukprot:6936-Heterococcus_DN1.PRE.3